MPKVTFVNAKLEIEVPQGANLRDEAMKAGVPVYDGMNRYLNCFGNGHCGTCKVVVKKGAENLSPKGVMEKFTLWRMLSVIGHEQESRLACQCRVQGDVTIETTPALPISPETDAKGKFFWETPYPNK
ncbi:MAG TPA: 2Fe-2S iron-sulfur cluster-binding protein [Gemmataceae bacterium]|nr:2Fe-2S iron-sulfur cluster-binding protein [Gemmataceae bacterium]